MGARLNGWLLASGKLTKLVAGHSCHSLTRVGALRLGDAVGGEYLKSFFFTALTRWHDDHTIYRVTARARLLAVNRGVILALRTAAGNEQQERDFHGLPFHRGACQQLGASATIKQLVADTTLRRAVRATCEYRGRPSRGGPGTVQGRPGFGRARLSREPRLSFQCRGSMPQRRRLVRTILCGSYAAFRVLLSARGCRRLPLRQPSQHPQSKVRVYPCDAYIINTLPSEYTTIHFTPHFKVRMVFP